MNHQRLIVVGRSESLIGRTKISTPLKTRFKRAFCMAFLQELYGDKDYAERDAPSLALAINRADIAALFD